MPVPIFLNGPFNQALHDALVRYIEGPYQEQMQGILDQAKDARDVAIDARNEALQATVHPGVYYDTLSELEADLDHPDGTMGIVDADGTASGVYRKIGAAGAGSWEKKSDVTIADLSANKVSKADLGSSTEAEKGAGMVGFGPEVAYPANTVGGALANLGDSSALNVGTTADTVAAGDHTHDDATTSEPGFLSAADKTKLDGLGDGAQVVSIAPGFGISVDDDDPANPVVSVDTSPLVILVTGQSNASNVKDCPEYTPPPNAFIWNYTGYPTEGTVGTAFVPLENNKMSWGRSIAIEFAKANPLRKIYLINIAWPAIPITKWLVGGTAPNMWDEITANVVPALAAIGKSQIDYLSWWEGESEALADALARATYYPNYESVIARFRTASWFPYATPVVLSEFSPHGVGAAAGVGVKGQFLQYCIGGEPALRSLAMLRDTPQSMWEAEDPPTYIHCNAEGYRQAGILAYRALMTNNASPDRHFGKIIQRISEGRNNIAVLSTDTFCQEIFVPLTIGYSYQLKLKFDFSIFNAAAGIRWGLYGPDAEFVSYQIRQFPQGGASVVTQTYQSSPVTWPSDMTDTGHAGIFKVKADLIIRNPVTSEPLRLRFAQAVATAGVTVVLIAGSYADAYRWRTDR